MKRIAQVVGALVLVALIALAVVVAVTLHSMQEDADAQRARFISRAEKLLPRYLEVSEVGADPFFTAERPDADAGPFLNPRLRWEGTPDQPGELALPANVHSKVQNWGDGWTEHSDDAAVDGADFGWMAELSKYGHWSLLSQSPISRLAKPKFVAMPIPSFLDLVIWTKLRLLKAHATGDYAQASAEVHQLAWLAFSTELDFGGMIAFAILKTERAAFDAWALPDPGGWKPYDAAWLDSARTALQASVVYAHPILPDELIANAGAAKFPRCAALNVAEQGVVVRRHFGAGVPGALVKAIEEPPRPCRLELARWIATAKDLDDADAFFGSDPSDTARLLFRLFPGVMLDIIEGTLAPEHALDKLEKKPE